MGHVHLTIRSPGESVQQFVAILQPETGQELHLPVHDIVPVGVLHEPQVRRLTDIDTAVAHQQPRSQVHSVGKHRHLVRRSVGIGVLKNLDPIAARRAGLRSQRILVQLQHPQTATLVPRHGHRIDDLGLGRKQADLKSGRNRERLLGIHR